MRLAHQQLIELGKGKALDFDRSETLVDIMRRQAKALPDNILLVYKDRSFTYKEIDEVTDSLAAHLIRTGIQQEEAVGVMIERSELMFIYSMAVMKAGGTYMPLDSHFPEERLMFMCEDAGVKTILSDDGLVQKVLPSFAGTIFESSQIAKLPSPNDVTFPDVKANDRMVILFTSGSTGKPKGVELEQHGIVNYCHAYVNLIDMKAEDRIVAYANYGFDVHMMDIYPPMLVGASVYILPDAMRLDFTAMHEYMEENKITVGFMTTTIATQMASLFTSTTLRVFAGGGEKMPPVTPPENYRFINFYGPTETSIGATCYDVKSYFEGEYIGQPLPEYNLYVVDKDMNLVPEGESGELLIAGTSVARGYLNRPELTAEKFIEFNGERAYRSGDLVRWATDPRDGSKQIEFLGRIDGQVKLRGLRIELGEVENRVAAFPAVQQACVAVKEIGGQQNLVCYYTEKAPVDTDELKSFIGETLTAFMVPEVYVKLNAMPLTPNGKVNRKALPVPEMAAGTTEIVAPETETEQKLFNITTELLKHNQFGVTTSLLSVGMTSLTAMRMSAMVKMQTGMALPSGMIMKTPTLRELAYLLTSGKNQATEEQIACVHDRQEYYPLTENQRGLYIDWEMNHEGLQYNLPDVKVIKGHTADELLKAMQQVVEAHSILKMRLTTVEGEVVQHRRDEAELPIVCQTLTEAPTAAFFQSRVRPFDLFNDDLCRIEIYTYDGKVFLFTDIHHIIYDGGSTFAFEGDTVKALNGEPLTTETYTAYDRALDEEEMHQMPMYEKAEKFFDSLMAQGYEVASYPHSLKPEGSTGSPTAKHGTQHAIATLGSQAVKDFCQASAITENNFFMTVVAQALHRLLREDDLLFTSITNGRMTPEMHDIIGMFVQTLPVISHIAKGSVVETMRQMQEQYIQTQDNSIMPYTKVVEKYSVKSEIMFAFQVGAGTLLDKNEEDAQYAVTTDTAMFPLAIQVIPTGNNYNVDIEFDTQLYNKKDIELLARAICSLAKNITESVDAVFQNLALVSKEETISIITKSYGGDLAYNAEETLVDKVIRHASERPDAIAVICNGESYTYAELNAASNAIAHRLIAEGVKPAEYVCIMLPRCKEFVAAVIGVMKAGAAYVPVDMEYPEDRKQYMIEDSEAKVVITEDWLSKNDTADDDVNLAESSGRAYMIYTSGTTGKPKGAVMLHRGLNAFLAWNNDRMHQTTETRHVVHASFSFDASIFDMLCALSAGGQVHIINEDLRRDLDGMAQYIADHKITGMLVTTQVGMALLNTYDLPLEYLMLGGEKMLPVRKTNVRVVNAYGPTEFTAASTYYDVQGDEEDIPIGRPVPNSYGLVVDSFGNLLPWGIAGELCMAGVQAGEGYWHRPELTAEKFFKVKLSGNEFDAYHTGDLVRYDEQGDIIYCGRIDNQVKLRGFRIEMGEIESRAVAFEGVKQAAAEVKKVNGQDVLCLYYTCKDNVSVDADMLKAHLAASLTAYMIPDTYTQMEEFPMTPGGKVNRKALPEPQVAAREYIAPCGEIETFFCNTFAEILGIERVGATDSFFEIGGTSIVAMRVIVAAVNAGYEIVYKNIFDNPTPREMQTYLTVNRKQLTVNNEGAVDHEVVDYDYTAINKLLAGNTLAALRGGKRNQIGVALVTGATGYLGIHIVNELLHRDDVATVYCLVRGNEIVKAESRMHTLLFYYFSDTFDELLGNKLVIIEGDVTNSNWHDEVINRLTANGQKVNEMTVFNCAANVKHFSVGTDIEDINVGGCNTCIDFCLKTGARLIHTSTISVAGTVESDHPVESHDITETQLYWGQKLDNQYIHAKFIAERNVLEAIINRGLRAKIMRLGNLASRSSDGEFQINFRSNSFMGQLKGFQLLGCISYDSLTDDMEFSPIDEVAKAITLLSETPDECCVYQAVNSHRQIFSNVIECMRNIGIPVEMVEDDVFDARLQEAVQDPVKAGILQSMLAYNSDSDKYVAFNGENNVYTTRTLYRLGFSWSFTTWDYMEKFLAAIQGLGFFDDDYQR